MVVWPPRKAMKATSLQGPHSEGAGSANAALPGIVGSPMQAQPPTSTPHRSVEKQIPPPSMGGTSPANATIASQRSLIGRLCTMCVKILDDRETVKARSVDLGRELRPCV